MLAACEYVSHFINIATHQQFLSRECRGELDTNLNALKCSESPCTILNFTRSTKLSCTQLKEFIDKHYVMHHMVRVLRTPNRHTRFWTSPPVRNVIDPMACSVLQCANRVQWLVMRGKCSRVYNQQKNAIHKNETTASVGVLCARKEYIHTIHTEDLTSDEPPRIENCGLKNSYRASCASEKPVQAIRNVQLQIYTLISARQ